MSRLYLERGYIRHLVTEGAAALSILALCLLALALRGCA